jgi:hypothetical protein
VTDTEIRNKILELFEIESQKHTVEFDEAHFLDYLIYPPARLNSIKSSFKGARKYYRFMNRVELEFGICFRLPDLDVYYSIDKLVQKVKERLGKRNGNIIILKQRIGEKDRYYFESSLITILLGFYIWLKVNWLTLTLTFVAGFVIFWTLTARLHDKRHNKRLYQKITGKLD